MKRDMKTKSTYLERDYLKTPGIMPGRIMKSIGILLLLLIMIPGFKASAQLDLVIGTGTTNSYLYGPFYRSSSTSSYDYSNYVYLYTSTELSTIPSGAIITGIAWDKSNSESMSGTNYLEIMLENTTQTSIAVSGNNYTTETATSTLVFSDNAYTVPGTVGWLEHTLTNPFIYSGGNLKIAVGHIKSGTATGAINFNYESLTGMAGGISASSPTVSSTFTSSYSDRRPNIKISYIVPNIPHDAGVVSIDEPVFPSAPGLHDVKATITTIGNNALTSCTINWAVNGVAQTPYPWTGNLAQFQTAGPITLGNFNFPQGVNEITVWTSDPNNLVDSFPDNDTATVSFLFTNPLSGVYTIGGATPDFATFSDAYTALDAGGVSGPVIFNVEPGLYTERLTLTDIAGTSSFNTITFKSSTNDSTDVILEDTLSSTGEAIIMFNGAKYFTFSHMTVRLATGSSAGRIIQFDNSAHYNQLLNNVIETELTTSSSYAGIYSTGSNDNYNVFANNHIKNGYYGIYWRGNSTSDRQLGGIIENNLIEDFYYYGIYTYYNDSLQIVGNKAYPGAHSGTVYGYYIYYTYDGFTIANNEFFYDDISNSGTKYGFRIYYGNYFSQALPGYAPGMVYNNTVNINNSGTKYGMYLYYNDNTNYYHNTIYLSGAGSTVRPLYRSNTTSNTIGENFANNIFVDNVGNFAAYHANTNSLTSSHNNVYYTNGGHVAYWGSNQTTLADFQLASLMEANSIEADPVFASPVLNNMTPMSSTVDNAGTPVGILTDIYGAVRSTTTPDVGAIEFTGIGSDIAIIGGELVNSECLSTNDSVYITISNVIGSTVNFSTATLTAHWSVTGPVNSNGTITINSGTLAPAADMTVGGAGVDLSVPGDYTLDIYISANSVNTFDGNDTLIEAYKLTIWNPFEVSPKNVIITSSADTVEISAKSTFFPPGAFLITEICQYAGTSTGQPTGGKPSFLGDDYIEITGVPNSDLAGYVVEKWQSSGTAPDVTHTFPAGSYLSPNGTFLLSTYQGTASPQDYHQVADVTSSYSSTTSGVNILKDPNGNIVDVVLYGTSSTIPAATGVTTQWTGAGTDGGSSWGIRLIGPDTDNNTNWVKADGSPQIQDPGTLNTGVPLPSPVSITGFTWSHNGVVTSNNVVDTVVGPWSTSGVYEYVASYITPCGTLSDTVTIIVSILNVSSDTAICLGDSVELFVDFPGTGPWTIIVSDGTGVDTISGIPVSPFSIYVNPTATTTYSILGYMDASNVLIPSSETVTVTVHPLPTVTLPGFEMCENVAPVTLNGLPAGGVYTGTGVNVDEFDPTVAGVGSHFITYHYTDVNGCENFADTVIDVHPVPVVDLGSDFDVCADGSATIDAGAGFDTYLWSTAATTQSITVDGATIGLGNTMTFSVTVTNTFGCEGEDEVDVTAIDCTGLDELSSESKITIWPNPSKGNFSIDITGINGDATIRILKSTGEVVSAEHLTINGSTSKEFDLDNLAAGLYYIQIITKNGSVTEKLMIR